MGVTRIDSGGTLYREDLKTDRLYVDESTGGSLFSVDGIGCVFYDSVAEGREQTGLEIIEFVQKVDLDHADDSLSGSDVWLKFEDEGDDEPSHEANTYREGDGYVVKWSHTAVGLVSAKSFDTLREARAWLESEGFSDFTS